MIGLGFADNIKQVEQMVADVDDDDSGQIEFPEFLKIISSTGGDASKMTVFFRDLCSGKYGEQ